MNAPDERNPGGRREAKAVAEVPVSLPGVDRRTRRERRGGGDRRKKDVPVAVERRSGQDRRGTGDRRALDPAKTAGSYDLDADTLEFIHAINRFKAETGRPFPTWSEVLSIFKGLGYRRAAPPKGGP